jgi:glycosyltransferase involved in cell wall biosynthesis
MKILLKREKFDILYCNDIDTLIVTYLFRKRYKFRIVYDSHELWTERKGSKKTVIHRFVNIIEYYIEKYMVRRCDAVITVSEGIAEELSRRYKIKKPYVIRNLDEIKEIPSYKNRMLLRDKLGIPRSAILLVYHGILADERGIPELIDAMDELPENIHLLLMGKYLPDHSRKALKYKGRIHYIGMIPQDELHIYTSIADIGIHPMRTKNILNHYLTFPNKLTQYTNMGLAIAVYKGPETRRIIKQCRCGIIFESGNSGNIVKGIRKIIESGKLSEYKILSRKTFLQYYNWQIDKQKLIKIIKEL